MNKVQATTEKWFLIDADGKVLGKIAAQIAVVLRGKNKVTFDPAKDLGDNVIVINAEKVVVTGNKEEAKKYYSHSRHPGGFKKRTLSRVRKEKPEHIIFAAVKGMMPKNKLASHVMTRRLKIYAGAAHPHEAQKPEVLDF